MNQKIRKAIYSLSDCLYEKFSIKLDNNHYKDLEDKLAQIHKKNDTESEIFFREMNEWKAKIPFTDKGFSFRNSSKLIAKYYLVYVHHANEYEFRDIKRTSVPFKNQNANNKVESLWDKKRPNYINQHLDWVMKGGEGVDFCHICDGNGYNDCKKCNGFGKVTGGCWNCIGTGEVFETIQVKNPHSYSSYENKVVKRRCGVCNGGHFLQYDCEPCRGRGKTNCTNCKSTGKLFTFRTLHSKISTDTKLYTLNNEQNVQNPFNNSTEIYYRKNNFDIIDPTNYSNKISEQISALAAYIELYNIKSNDQSADVFIVNGNINYPDENLVRSFETHTEFIVQKINELPDAITPKKILSLCSLYIEAYEGCKYLLYLFITVTIMLLLFFKPEAFNPIFNLFYTCLNLFR